MTLVIADRIRDTTTTTGTGSLTVSGTPPTGFKAFSSVLANADTSVICIQHQSADEWEVCETTSNGSTGLTRGTLLASSTGSRVSFSAGTKDVWIDFAAGKIVDVDRPQTLKNKTLDAPALGTPASGDLRNCTGSVPAGAVFWFAASTAPTGYLECDGSAVSRTAYAALFTAISTTFGTGNGSTTFNLPDLRGRFVRAWDHSKGLDSGRSFGSTQADELKAHGWHGNSAQNKNASSGSQTYVRSDGFNGQVGGSETRPVNIALLPCIAY